MRRFCFYISLMFGGSLLVATAKCNLLGELAIWSGLIITLVSFVMLSRPYKETLMPFQKD